ncbi:hypothetical protein F6X40_39635 [Paraburkholderia sp. UCT31]|uniref:DUF4286 family protein n=1 Tax=Paraburkholderia sp. UCT31 TaxID=2615209 RepID=UPI0016554818|nr:DUF4286 family protein [Paraburkholderia sp. UCT31]MBC8742604.1 hypothetical protein [Paraburkholderia sp. UCT31]
MRQSTSSLQGQLCIWTDTEPAQEANFNAWYDREHMQERVALPGFRYARRFKATDGGPRGYLALYVTEALEVFRSAPYQQAFTEQTPWSLANFARMRNTQRRVGELTIDAGDGEGAFLALFVLPPERVEPARMKPRLDAAVTQAGIHAARLFCTAPALSVPLNAAAGASQPPADALVLIEGSDAAATHALAKALAGEMTADAGEPGEVRTFQLLWRISAG